MIYSSVKAQDIVSYNNETFVVTTIYANNTICLENNKHIFMGIPITDVAKI